MSFYIHQLDATNGLRPTLVGADHGARVPSVNRWLFGHNGMEP
jgi:hypothetical protein